MIPVRFEPPRTEGTAEERLRALEAWARMICERHNVMVDSLDGFNKAEKDEMVKAVIAALPVYDGEVVAV